MKDKRIADWIGSLWQDRWLLVTAFILVNAWLWFWRLA